MRVICNICNMSNDHFEPIKCQDIHPYQVFIWTFIAVWLFSHKLFCLLHVYGFMALSFDCKLQHSVQLCSSLAFTSRF